MSIEQNQDVQSNQSQAVAGSNLLDVSGVTKEVQEQQNSQIDANAEAVQNWFWGEGMSGEGDKPEWLLPKYRSVSDQAKAYVEAEKRLGSFIGAPKNGYDTSFIEESGLDKESVHLNKFLEVAKKMNLSQDGLQDILGIYSEYESLRAPDINAELEKLGDNGKQQLQVLNQWATNNLTDKEYSQFTGLIRTAEDVNLFMKLRGLTREQPVPNGGKAQVRQRTPEQISQAIQDNYDAYLNNTNGFRDKVTEEMQNAI